MQVLLDQKMKNMECEIEVFFNDQDERLQEILKNNSAFFEDPQMVLSQLKEDNMTFEVVESLKEVEQLELNHHLLVEQQQAFQRGFNNIRESLGRLENLSNEALDFKVISSELMEYASRRSNESKAELMLNIIKAMGLFRFRVDHEGWLSVSRVKGNRGGKEISYENVRSVEKLHLKMDGIEFIEMMILGLNFLLDNCLEKVSELRFDFCGRFISNQEARRFSSYASIWSERKINLTVNFNECIFENQEIPQIFFQNERLKLENIEGFKCLLENTNATQKTTDGVSKLIVSRMKNLEQFKFDFCAWPIKINEVLLSKASRLKKLDFGVKKSVFRDDELSLLSEKVLPELKNLEELKLGLDQTQITDKGLMNLFKSIKENCASGLKIFGLSTNENNVSDESIRKLPLMENLEEFELFAKKTLITDKSMVLVGESIKYFASRLRRLGLDLGQTVIIDGTINALASSIPLMKKIEEFSLCLYGTKISDQSMRNLYFSIGFAGVFSNVQRFELDCSETAVTDDSLIIFANRGLVKMKKLKKFAFIANKTKLQDSSLQVLFKSLSAASEQLYDLNLSFEKTELGDKSILSLGETLSEMVNLENLVLSFNQTRLTDKSIGPLCSSFRSLARNLESLSLGLDHTKVTDQALLVLGNEIAPEMISLKEFKLRTSRTRVGDASLKPLFEKLKGTMAHIEVLHLCFNDSLIGDKALTALAQESLIRAESLKSVKLWVNNTVISDLGMALMSSLGNKVCNLKTLVLSFKGTKQNIKNLWINETYTSIFFDSLAQKIQNVREFELELNDFFRDLSIQSFADKVLPNFIHVENFKLSWTAKLSSLTYAALCLNAKKTIKNIKTFAINSSSFSITTGLTNKLQEISFEFNDMTDITMEQIIGSFEGQISQVRIFSFIVKGTKVSDRSLKALAHIFFLFMPNLESLAINLDKLEISDDAFCYMCRSFEPFAKNLKHFKISLGIPSLCTPSITALAEYGLSQMKDLENFELDYCYNKNTEQGLVVLFTQMQNFTQKLQGLSLFLPGARLLPKAVQALALDIFPNLKNLKTLQLGMLETKICESDFLLLFSGMKGVLESVKDFAWAIDEDSFTNQALESFSNHILPRLKNLENLKFYIANNVKITDEGFIRFNKKLQGVSSKITDLMLRFENSVISNEGVNEFALKTLYEMKSLKNVDISFGENAGINDQSLGNLFDSLGGIVGQLNSLQLGLQNTGLGDVGIERFKEKMGERVEHLEKFSLNVAGCNLSIKNQSFINGILKEYHQSSLREMDKL